MIGESEKLAVLIGWETKMPAPDDNLQPLDDNYPSAQW